MYNRFTAKELGEQDFDAFLASSDDSEEEEEEEEEQQQQQQQQQQKGSAGHRWKKITEDNLASYRQELLGVYYKP